MIESNIPHSALQGLLNEAVRTGGAPGAAVALSRNGARTFAAAGTACSSTTMPLTPSSRVVVGCIAKMLTAIVALELAGERRIDLSAPIEEYLHELRGTALGRTVRAEHLLTHTSGIRGPNVADASVRYYYSWDQLVRLLRFEDPLFTPGTFFNYEHTESVLIAEIVQRITDTDILDLYHSTIFAPLGIAPLPASRHTSAFDLAEHTVDPRTQRLTALRPAPPCAFWRASLSDSTLNLTELLEVAEAAAGMGTAPHLRPETVSAMQTPYVLLPHSIGGPLREANPCAFGFGCARYEAGVFGHNGSARGQTCSVRYVPSASLVVVVAINAWRPHLRDMICRKIVSAATAASTTPSAPTGADWVFDDLVGRYTGPVGASAEVVEEGGQLICLLSSTAKREFLRLVVTRSNDGNLQLVSDAPQLTLAFSDTDTVRPRLMMVGLSTYRRVA